MAALAKVFLDTSVLFAGIWSSEGGGRMILKLGEAGMAQLFVSRQVLRELEATMREKDAARLGGLAVLLERSRITILPDPTSSTLTECGSLVNHTGDAVVLAAAWDGEVEYFVTLDKKHFLENERLRATADFLIGTPGDFLAWFRSRLGGV